MFKFLEESAWLPPLSIVIMVALFVAAHFMVQRSLKIKEGNETVGFLAHQIGILYAVLIGFIAVTSWNNFDNAALIAENETNSLADVYRIANNFSKETKERIQTLALRYAKLLVSKEWPLMQEGGESKAANQTAGEIFDALASFQPQAKNEANLQKQGLKEVLLFLDNRRERLDKNLEGFPNVIWIILLVGAILMIGITFFIYPYNRIRQLIMTGMLTALIGMQLTLINEFAYPFRGTIIVSPTRWEKMIEKIQNQNFY